MLLLFSIVSNLRTTVSNVCCMVANCIDFKTIFSVSAFYNFRRVCVSGVFGTEFAYVTDCCALVEVPDVSSLRDRAHCVIRHLPGGGAADGIQRHHGRHLTKKGLALVDKKRTHTPSQSVIMI